MALRLEPVWLTRASRGTSSTANAYATSKAAVEAHTLNLAAELAGSGITVNVFRPGAVDTAMQAWIRNQDPVLVGVDLHRRFVENYEQGTLLSPEQSAASLLADLPSPDTGQIWEARRSPLTEHPTARQGGQW